MEDRIDSAVASGFAGGIGNSGSVCGAVIGAVMAIGLRKGHTDSMPQWLENLATVREFRRRFEEEMGSTVCRDLTGIDLTTPEGISELMSSDRPQSVCVPAVTTAYRLVHELLEAHP